MASNTERPRIGSAFNALNDRQRLFVREYLVDLNATKAAIRAGYSARTARVQASELLAKPDISDAIIEYREHLATELRQFEH